ncbi:hypothetical protein VTN77DRAFT_7608 [Rasamsonia byssochlamydoides]|uniref:uncharacterized protein n=1 Tax=Rasamsonia byssochlamydoides TaxID=89139 RepID=UPI003742903A
MPPNGDPDAEDAPPDTCQYPNNQESEKRTLRPKAPSQRTSYIEEQEKEAARREAIRAKKGKRSAPDEPNNEGPASTQITTDGTNLVIKETKGKSEVPTDILRQLIKIINKKDEQLQQMAKLMHVMEQQSEQQLRELNRIIDSKDQIISEQNGIIQKVKEDQINQQHKWSKLQTALTEVGLQLQQGQLLPLQLPPKPLQLQRNLGQ